MSDRTVNSNGADIHVRESGVGEPVLVFLHYWGGWSRTWQSLDDRIGEKPRVIVLDQRGWGASVATDGRYDLAAMADDVEAVAQTFGLKRYALVGHSMGGKVAQIVAARRPAGRARVVSARRSQGGGRRSVMRGRRPVSVRPPPERRPHHRRGRKPPWAEDAPADRMRRHA
ncbi:MAG: alpha/beta hydrolase [Hyphomicrobiales bacterium]|nr:alpha/beta hydrolase [Hyphomicrobiales bacterium]MBV8443640.1 alpha/beta hydrolase [Hyphomicrobiales bacterium]